MVESQGAAPDSNRSLHARIVVLFVIGFVYVFSIPPFEGPDEPAHFARAHGVAEGQLIQRDNARELARFIHEGMKIRHPSNPLVLNMERLLNEHEGRIPNIAWNTALYSPAPYLPHAGVIRIVTAFNHTSPGLRIALYLCRIVTLCLFIAFVYFASRISPGSSWPLFWVAATPMALAQASIVGIDCMVLGASALLLSACLGTLSRRSHAACLVLSSLLLATTKPTYLPLLLIPAMFGPHGEERGAVHGVKPFLLALAISVFAFLAWSHAAATHEVFQPMAEGMKRFFGVTLDPSHQLKWILQSPLQFLMIVVASLGAGFTALARQFVGVLGWLNAPIPVFAVVAWWIASPAAVLISDPAPGVGRWKWLSPGPGPLCMIAALGVILCIYISGFMMWTPVGAATIFTQGRYFHPVVFVLFVGLALVKPMILDRGFKRLAGRGLILLAVVINITALFTAFF